MRAAPAGDNIKHVENPVLDRLAKIVAHPEKHFVAIALYKAAHLVLAHDRDELVERRVTPECFSDRVDELLVHDAGA